MRKTILWLIILCCAGIGFWFFRKSETGPALSDALPADALVAIELIDLENRIDRLKAGRLGKTLKTIDVQDLMTRLDAPPDAINDYHEIETALVTITDSMIFKELFGQHTLIAVLPAEPAPVKSVFTQNPVHDPFDPIVVVSRPKAGGELAEFFSFIFSKRFKIETEAFHNHQVKRFQVDDNRTVHYTLVKGLLVAAAKRRNLEACLLVFDGNQDSLTQNDRYQTLRNRVNADRAHRFLYADVKGLFEQVGDALNVFSTDRDTVRAPERGLGFWKMLDVAGFASFDAQDKSARDKFIFKIDPAVSDRWMGSGFNSPPANNVTLPLIPSGVLFYGWTAGLDLFYPRQSSTKNNPDALPAIGAAKTWLEKRLGVDFEDAGKAFGSQFGVVLKDIATGGFIPFPQAAIAVQVKNRETAERLIGSILDQFRISPRKAMFEGIILHHIPVPFTANEPAYAFFDDVLLLSSNLELLREMVSTANTGGGIIEDPGFQTVNNGLTDKNNWMCFVDAHRLSEKMTWTLRWTGAFMAFKDREAAMRLTTLLEGAAYPLLEALGTYRSIGARTVIDNHEIETDIYYRLDG